MRSMKEKYNDLADIYHANRGQFDNRPLFEAFYNRLKGMESGRVLDLGCGIGDGFPAYFFDKGWQVEGIDFSDRMLDLANRYHPEMKTICGCLEDINLPKDSYDVIESIYALFHLNNVDQHKCLIKCYEALKKGGHLFFTYATEEYTGSKQFEGFVHFMNEDLFYAHRTPDELQKLLQEIGFKDICISQDTIGGESLLWVDAEK